MINNKDGPQPISGRILWIYDRAPAGDLLILSYNNRMKAVFQSFRLLIQPLNNIRNMNELLSCCKI